MVLKRVIAALMVLKRMTAALMVLKRMIAALMVLKRMIADPKGKNESGSLLALCQVWGL